MPAAISWSAGKDSYLALLQARAAGLEYRHLPVNGAFPTPEQIAAFATLAAQLPRPLLLFCRSGARSTKLYQAAQALR